MLLEVILTTGPCVETVTKRRVRTGIAGRNSRQQVKPDRDHGELLDRGAMRPPLRLFMNSRTRVKYSLGCDALPERRHP